MTKETKAWVKPEVKQLGTMKDVAATNSGTQGGTKS